MFLAFIASKYDDNANIVNGSYHSDALHACRTYIDIEANGEAMRVIDSQGYVGRVLFRIQDTQWISEVYFSGVAFWGVGVIRLQPR